MRTKIRKEVRRIPGYHLDQPDFAVKMNQNESAYDLPVSLKRRVIRRLARLPWNRYPAPYADSLVKKIARRERWVQEGVLVANGSNVLTQAMVAATAVGGKVMVLDPSFSLYSLYGELFNNRVINVPLGPDFSLDREAFIRRMKRAKPNLVFIPNPNAPTGTLYNEADLKAIVRAAPCLVVIDEAYYPFSGSTLKGSLKRYKNLVLLRTFSKAYSLGGVRVGYMLAAPEVIYQVRKLVAPFCVNALSVLVAETVLDSPKYVERVVKEVKQERAKLFDGLSDMPGITPFPSAANFLLFRTRQATKIYQGLIKKGVLIRNVADGKRLRNCLRVTVGSPRENAKFLREIERLV